MTSVARKIHMPRLAELRCCSSVAKWCSRAGLCRPSWTEGCAVVLSDNFHLLLFLVRVRGVDLVVVVGFPGHDGLFVEVEGRRRRLRFPFESGGIPRVVRSGLAVTHRPEEVDHGQHVADAENRGSGGREHVQNLKLSRILIVAARHAEISEDELREEREVETDEYDQRSQLRPAFGIELAGNFRPPEMHAAEISHDRAADHDVVEVGDYEICIGDVNVDSQAGEEETGESADGEQAEESEGVEHGRVVVNRSLVERGCPVENLHCRGHRDGVTEHGEYERRVEGNSGDEHMVRPDEETEDGDG